MQFVEKQLTAGLKLVPCAASKKEGGTGCHDCSMSNYSLSNRLSDNTPYIPVLWFTVLFAVISYVAVSTRAILSPFEANAFVDAKRLLSVGIGAAILWFSISAAERLSEQGPRAQILAILNIAIPGAIGLLLVREAYDLFASGELAQRLALNLRWMLTWVGYFAAASATFLALSYHRQLQVARACLAAAQDSATVRGAPAKEEVSELLVILRSNSGYEVADAGPSDLPNNERIARIDQLAAKLVK